MTLSARPKWLMWFFWMQMSGSFSPNCPTRRATTCLYGKGFRQQAALAQKMEQAKKSKPETGAASDAARAEFAQLLAQRQPLSRPFSDKTGGDLGASSGSGATEPPKSPPRKEQSRESNNRPMDLEPFSKPLRVGDKARRLDFESLIDVATGRPLGPLRAAELVPWVPPHTADHLIVLADPRRQSSDLRQAMEYLPLKKHDKCRFLVVSADESPKAWKRGVANETVLVTLDSKSLDWMTTYECTQQYNLHLLVIDNDGILQSKSSGLAPSDVSTKVRQLLEQNNRA